MELLGARQPAINRYEHGQAAAPFSILQGSADYFDVSLDYTYGRTGVGPAAKKRYHHYLQLH